MALMSRLAMELRTTSGRDRHQMLRTTLVQWHLDKGFTSGQICLFDHCFLRPANCILLSMRLKHSLISSLLKCNLTSRALLRCRAARRQDYWSAQKVKKFEIIVGPGPGTLMKPKYHYMVVWGLLVQELEPLKDLKAEKGWFFDQN